ncbi:50S ribosome-binding GTPase [Brachybacterium sp. EF45031]|uniref:GTPase n=1 Tax=Brachybacterium sillae TaxID=2810536 RepID=UPI00217DF2E9|nr:GTPase [Brachybacterium sillae]MCS6711318.1 50S ribosome-binding GTPase [Brachybacterium sillae]
MRLGGRRTPTLVERLDALDRARAALHGVAPEAELQHAEDVLDRIDRRRALSAEHTVIGFFGATGSGKSSLVNALVGREITRAAVRRPTTAQPVAAVLGGPDSEPLLDWLEVSERHVLDGTGTPLEEAHRRGRSRRRGEDADTLPGLLLLDLPDMDSVELANREVAERMTGLVDVLVWVTDPQKYADDVLHHDFVTPFAGHDAVTMVVLNQLDRIRPTERKGVVASLTQLVRRDGLESAPVHAVSAQTGEGLDDLRRALLDISRGHDAAAQRQKADVREAAERLDHVASPAGLPQQVRPGDVDALVEDLAAAARVDQVGRAVGASYRHRASARTGWPLLRWMARLRPDPLRRWNIGQERAPEGLSRTSLPEPDAATRARASAGVRGFADASSAGAGDPWRAEVRRAARSREDELPDALDQAVAGADLRAREGGWWWPVLDVLQWLALLCAVVGLGWLALNAVLLYFQVPPPPMPMIRELWVPIPLPTALVALGLLAGVLFSVASVFAAGLAAAHHRRRAVRILRERVRDVARTHVVEPVEDVLDRGADTATDLSTARGERR